MDLSFILLTTFALVVACVLAALMWRRRGDSSAVEQRLDRLESVLREAVAGSGEVVVARMKEGLEVKHRELSEGLTRILEERTRRIEETVRALKEQNQAQLLKQERELRELTDKKLTEVTAAIAQLKGDTAKTLADLRQALSESLADSTRKTSLSLQETMKLATDTMDKRFADLRQVTDRKLTDISGKVAERLDEGFKKTTEAYTSMVKRLTIIDEAQKKIADLSREMVSLQDILSDKKARGVFGEVQLNQLVVNTLPEGSYALQHDLGEGRRADCVLFLPEPTGTVAIDAKFPLENYRRMFDTELSPPERAAAARQFKQDVKAHIEAIASKYIVAGKTSDGAVMFLPAEAVFAELHGHHPDLVELAQKKRVWITSPTTMMAILTTARAVLKDQKTREQVHIIQQHLGALAKDFDRFQGRMDKLAVHIRQAHEDVDQVHTSARKITARFEKIERVQLEEPPAHGAPPPGKAPRHLEAEL